MVDQFISPVFGLAGQIVTEVNPVSHLYPQEYNNDTVYNTLL